MDQRWLEKAIFAVADTDPNQVNGAGGLLSPQQTATFLRLAVEASTLLPIIRNESSANPKFEIPRISMNDRILHAGVEGSRVTSGNFAKPVTGLMTLSTELFKGEVPVSDETFEDQIERARLADTIMTMIAQAVGRDVEELGIKSDTSRTPGVNDPAGDADFDKLDGFVARAQDAFPAGQKVDTSALASPEDVMAKAIEALPARYRRNPQSLRFLMPVAFVDAYQDSLAQRGTGLGDQAITDNMYTRLAFRGTPIIPIPILSGTSTINGVAVDYSKFGFLTDPQNMVIGWHRRVRIEKWRDPREGVTSFLPTVRFDVDWVNPEASILAHSIPSFA